MVRKISELRQTPDDVLIAEHDSLAGNTNIGTDYYMRELERRAFERSAQASNRLAVRSFWLAVASAVLSLVATVVSMLALVLTR